jgi:hypothetical protein
MTLQMMSWKKRWNLLQELSSSIVVQDFFARL